MKRIFITLAIVLTISSLALWQTVSQSKSCEQTAKELELRGIEIAQNFDKAGYGQFLSDDAVIIANNGEAFSKNQGIASLTRPTDLTSVSYATKDVNIRICGETNIVVIGKDITTIKEKGKKESTIQLYWFTRVYEKRRAQWQLIYSQLTDLAE
ncbi:MAG: nuclear transport factor 2 family protein [Acidobacteria bacterium]|nr:nuclear transport factor 2 family protein [Acidobacteriota bacterium]